MPVTIRPAELEKSVDAAAVVAMVRHYALHPMAGAVDLSPDVQAVLAERLAAFPTRLVWLAWEGERPVGVAVCFLVFSTFSARPRINIHDLAVHEDYRGQRIGQRLLEAVEAEARRRDCSELTLEVRGDNRPAQKLYARCGFTGAAAVDPPESMAFWKKSLS